MLKPKFRTSLHFRDDGGFPLTLTRALVYDSEVFHGRITAKAGFRTDLASIPRILWNILPPIGKYDKAAVVHDWLYQHNGCTRKVADQVLLEAMRVCGVNKAQRALIYSGVRVGGWVAWRKYRKGKK